MLIMEFKYHRGVKGNKDAVCYMCTWFVDYESSSPSYQQMLLVDKLNCY